MIAPWTLAAAVVFTLVVAAAGPAHAGTPLVLPPGERASDWADALALGGFEASPAGASPPVVVVVAGATAWTLKALDAAGRLREARVDPPTTEAAREDLVWLAASLLSPAPSPPPASRPSSPTPRGAPPVPRNSVHVPPDPVVVPALPEPVPVPPDPVTVPRDPVTVPRDPVVVPPDPVTVPRTPAPVPRDPVVVPPEPEPEPVPLPQNPLTMPRDPVPVPPAPVPLPRDPAPVPPSPSAPTPASPPLPPRRPVPSPFAAPSLSLSLGGSRAPSLASALRAGASWPSGVRLGAEVAFEIPSRLDIAGVGGDAGAVLALAGLSWAPPLPVAPALGLSAGVSVRPYLHDGSLIEAAAVPVLSAELGLALRPRPGVLLVPGARAFFDLRPTEVRAGEEGDFRPLSPLTAHLGATVVLSPSPPTAAAPLP